MNKTTGFLIKLLGIIFIIFSTYPAFAQKGKTSVIRGTIKCEQAPLSYATIYLKDTQLNTSADENGNFVFHVPAGNHILCVRYVGYETLERAIHPYGGILPLWLYGHSWRVRIMISPKKR